MSITQFDYPSYYGIRVQRNAGDETRVKYFSFKVPRLGGEREAAIYSDNDIKKIWSKARALDNEWSIWQRFESTKIKNQYIPTKKNTCTRVRGITMLWKYKNKCGKIYGSFVFCWSGHNSSGIAARKCVTIYGDGKDAWQKIITFMCEEKKMEASVMNDLLTRCPKKSEINKSKLSLMRNKNA